MSCSTAGKLATIKVLRRNLSFLSAPAPASGVIAKVLNSTEGAHLNHERLREHLQALTPEQQSYKVGGIAQVVGHSRQKAL